MVVDGGLGDEVQSVAADGPRTPIMESNRIVDARFRPAVDRNLPDARTRSALPIIKDPAVDGFEAGQAAVFGDRNGGAAGCGHLPDLLVAAPIGAEIHRSAVPGPARCDVVGSVVSQAAR